MHLPLPAPCSEVEQLARYWESLRGDDLVPEWDVVKAGRAVPRLLPHMNLVQVVVPPCLLIRLAGTALREFHGFQVTGRDMLDLTPQHQRAARYMRYFRIVNHPCGLNTRAVMKSKRGVPFDFQQLLLPVRRAGHDRPMILSLWILHGAEPSRDHSFNVGEPPLAHEADFIDIGAGSPNIADTPPPLDNYVH